MTRELMTVLILSAVSIIIQLIGYLIPKLTRVSAVICWIWLIISLPAMLYMNLSSQYVLMFYLLSALAGLVLNFGGRPE